MKKLVAALITILLLLLASCAGQGFTASSVSLSKVEDALLFSFIPDKDDSYELILRSPDGELEWSSQMTKDDPYMVSDELCITEGASFPEGEYTWFVISSDGTELNGTVTI